MVICGTKNRKKGGFILELEFWAAEDTISLYWEKPEGFGAHVSYQVFCGNIMAGETDRTHFEMEGLKPEKEYHILVKAFQKLPGGEGQKETGKQLYEFGEIVVSTPAKRRRLNVTQYPYHAVGDGKTRNTAKLQKAIDDCGKDGCVYFPEGIYLTGALCLHSDMELYLDEGAILLGTEEPADYLPRILSRFEGTELECYRSLLNLGQMDHKGDYNCQNVVIRGKGSIAGGGRVLAERIIAAEKERLLEEFKAHPEWVAECETPETIPGRVRPRLLQMSNCRNIILSGLCLKNGASWNVHMIYSDHILTKDCQFHSENIWNGDGWDPDSSTNCTIFGCEFYTGDDAIAVKSGKNPQGNIIARPAEHIRIFDCHCASGHGIAIGSEMSGGVDDVKIWDCDLGDSKYGIEIKGTEKRGGYVHNVQVKDCVVPRLLFHSVAYNDDGQGASHPPLFSDCSFERIHILGEYPENGGKRECSAMEFLGFARKGYELENILLRDILIGLKGEGRRQQIALQYCKNITMERIYCL